MLSASSPFYQVPRFTVFLLFSGDISKFASCSHYPFTENASLLNTIRADLEKYKYNVFYSGTGAVKWYILPVNVRNTET